MNYYDEKLKELHAQVMQKRNIDHILGILSREQEKLQARRDEFDAGRQAVITDPDIVERHSLAAFFHKVIAEDQTKEEQILCLAYEAAVQYDLLKSGLAGIENDLLLGKAELIKLQSCEEEFALRYRERQALAQSFEDPETEACFLKEERTVVLESQKVQLRDAITCGERAESTANRILKSLDQAEGWGTWDTIGGGEFTEADKLRHMDDAQRQVERLQAELGRFCSRLESAHAFVGLGSELDLNIFLQFAGYFYNGLFSDWLHLHRVGKSREQIKRVIDLTEQTLKELRDKLLELDQELL